MSGFVPISLNDFVEKHLKSNPGDERKSVMAQMKRALKDYAAGKKCQCGNPIWVIGSSIVGNSCFTCITGEAYPEDDYELAEAMPHWEYDVEFEDDA